jgi:two-component system KDP operon response regulator KdpE
MSADTDPPGQQILIIEDEPDLICMLQRKLCKEGYVVRSANDGVQGLQAFQRKQPHLVLLDVLMPCMDGWETLRCIRELSDVPVIMLTCLSEEQSIVRGLELGADDYLTKPFGFAELLARVRAALRRCEFFTARNGKVKIDECLLVDRALCQAVVNGETVSLTPIEFKILSCFVDNLGRILTHQSLLTQVWGWEYCDQTDYLKVYIHNLRKKIEPDPRNPQYIQTERGLGYRFMMP